MRWKLGICLILLCMPGAGSTALAHEGGDRAALRDGRDGSGQLLAQAGKSGKKDDEKKTAPEMFSGDPGDHRAMVAWKLTEELDLDQETAEKFFPLYNESEKRKGELYKKKRELAHTIQDLLEKSGTSDTELMKYAREYDETYEAIGENRREFLASARKILNDRQYVQLMVFDERLRGILFKHFRSLRKGDDSPLTMPDTSFQVEMMNRYLENIDRGPDGKETTIPPERIRELEDLRRELDSKLKDLRKNTQ